MYRILKWFLDTFGPMINEGTKEQQEISKLILEGKIDFGIAPNGSLYSLDLLDSNQDKEISKLILEGKIDFGITQNGSLYSLDVSDQNK